MKQPNLLCTLAGAWPAATTNLHLRQGILDMIHMLEFKDTLTLYTTTYHQRRSHSQDRNEYRNQKYIYFEISFFDAIPFISR